MKNADLLPHATGIYKITNLINGKVYIGQAQDIYERWWNTHKYSIKSSPFQIYQAIRKYGEENFEIDVIELVPQEQLNEREIYWISTFDSFKNGYNMTEGGASLSPNIHSAETEEKRRQTREKNQSLIGENHPRAKLSNEEVIAIRQRYIDGESSKSIYEDYKDLYSFPTFQEIILGRHYSRAGNIPTQKDKNLQRGKFSEDQINRIRQEYYENDRTQSSLANEYGVSQSTIKDIVNFTTYAEIFSPYKDNPTKRKRAARFTNQQVREIREAAAQGASTKELAEKYNSTINIIYKCIKRITYPNVT